MMLAVTVVALVMVVWTVKVTSPSLPEATITATPPRTMVVTCYEDQYARVMHDPDPNHGLTWECVDADDVHEQWFDGGWNAAIECMYGGGVVKTWGCEE